MQKNIFLLLFLWISAPVHSQTIRERIQERRAGKTANNEPSIAPDYTNLDAWAAHPGKKDMSDSIAPFITNETRDTLADVFFLHPTTYTKDLRNASWNASLDDEVVNSSTDSRTILFQASVFNNCCRVFAPRYRQAHLKAYFAPNSNDSKNAFDLAYEDLKNAFEFYLANFNKGRPIVIASHSQGAMHAIRLLKEFFDGKALQKQLVCAYVVGWPVKEGDLSSIKVSETPTQTGGFVSWRSYKKGETDFIIENEKGNVICVNPISWTTSQTPTDFKQHKGAVGKDLNKLIPGVISASIEPEHHILWVDVPEGLGKQYGKLKNYHVADYNLFYMDIRLNVLERVKAFLKK